VIERQYHDLGGRPAGTVERTEHEYSEWEQRVDALERLLASKNLVPRDQRRKHIEALAPELYDSLSYYERWLSGLTQSLIERGIITTPELSRKMLEVGMRGNHDMGGLPAGKVKREEHDYELWERRVDALLTILAGVQGAKPQMTLDELRKNIEVLPPEAYEQMNYYDRWVSSITRTLIQRGVITTEELARKMAEVNGRTKV
jgi:Nitrile hydratase beta subunit